MDADMQNKTIKRNRMQIISYLFFGGLATLINIAVYAALVHFTELSITVSNAIALVVAVAFAFMTNKLWVFKSKTREPKKVFRELSTFIIARTITGIIDLVGVPLLFNLGLTYPLLGIEGFTAKAIITVIVIILNYVFSKVFVFRQNGESKSVDTSMDETADASDDASPGI